MPRKISRRASRTWEKLGQWYGSRLADNYGPTPPDDWIELIDRTDDERLNTALALVRSQTPIHPPTLGQLESSLPKREPVNTGPSVPQQLADLMLKRHVLCIHQLNRPWNYFGPMREFEVLPPSKPPKTITHPFPRGVQVAACEECGKPTYRVLLDQSVGEGVAA
jgi:hypothetical protein